MTFASRVGVGLLLLAWAGLGAGLVSPRHVPAFPLVACLSARPLAAFPFEGDSVLYTPNTPRGGLYRVSKDAPTTFALGLLSSTDSFAIARNVFAYWLNTNPMMIAGLFQFRFALMPWLGAVIPPEGDAPEFVKGQIVLHADLFSRERIHVFTTVVAPYLAAGLESVQAQNLFAWHVRALRLLAGVMNNPALVVDDLLSSGEGRSLGHGIDRIAVPSNIGPRRTVSQKTGEPERRVLWRHLDHFLTPSRPRLSMSVSPQTLQEAVWQLRHMPPDSHLNPAYELVIFLRSFLEIETIPMANTIKSKADGGIIVFTPIAERPPWKPPQQKVRYRFIVPIRTSA